MADADSEAALLEHALGATALQVERRCTALHNARRDLSTADAARAHRNRSLTRVIHEDGRMSLQVELPQEAGALVMQALERAMSAAEGEQDAEAVPEEEHESFFTRQADALVRVAQAYLSGEAASGRGEHGRWYFRTAEGKVIPEGHIYRPGADPARQGASRDASCGGALPRGHLGEPAALYALPAT